MSHNRAVLYSNGIADFHRRYVVRRGAATEISIPVRRDHIGDVLASLNIYGDVSLSSPPTFRPANEDAGNLSIQADGVLEGLATSLCGATVRIEKAGGPMSGTLMGLHHEPEGTAGERIEPTYFVVRSESGLQKVPLREVLSVSFGDAAQHEIDKALQRRFQEIKPNSTFVDLTIDTEQEETEAIVQYAIPAAAWKISYRLRQHDHGKFEFQGFAIVDNNTEEDWNDFLISVVTGEPITFSTDLADSKTPHREHVNVVRDQALGAVEVEAADFDLGESNVAAAMAPAMAMRETADARYQRSARTETAEVREVGDFCVFDAVTAVSIGAGRSAILPVFQTTLDEPKIVLHYKVANHANRPFRAVQFTNETVHSLGRGVCTVFQEGTFSGSCIMPATKPKETALLPHALETGVRVRQRAERSKRRTVGIRLSTGFCYTSSHESQQVTYRLKNNREDGFEVVLDHDFLLPDPDIDCSITRGDGDAEPCTPSESLRSGFRIVLQLEGQEELVFSVTESYVRESRVNLLSTKRDETGPRWLADNIVAANGPLADDAGVQACLKIQRELDDHREQIRSTNEEIERLTGRQNRLRENIKAGGNDEQTSQWRDSLGTTENRIVDLEENVVPRLNSEEQQILRRMRDTLKSLSAEWSARLDF